MGGSSRGASLRALEPLARCSKKKIAQVLRDAGVAIRTRKEANPKRPRVRIIHEEKP